MFRENRIIFNTSPEAGKPAEAVSTETKPGQEANLEASPAENPETAKERKLYAGTVVAEAQKDTEVQKASVMHSKYLDSSNGIDAEKAALDETKIQETSVLDLRKNARILNSTKEGVKETDEEIASNLKDETARRLRAYTKDRTGEWYTLDYAKFGKDKNKISHEMNIGLGDILVDTDIKEILVERNGKIIKATRGTVGEGRRHAGRVGFIDEQGAYVATLTGNKFRIISERETNIKNTEELQNYIKEIQKEDTDRKKTEIIMQKEHSSEFSGLPSMEVSDIDPNKSVVEQITAPNGRELNESQKAAARIIEDEFKKAGLNYPNLIAAAIVNAYHESGLRPDNGAITDKENSWGLFALNSMGGLGNGMSKEDRQNPVINIARVIKFIKNRENNNTILASAETGADVQKLTQLFCLQLENPADPELRAREREVASLSFFNNKPRDPEDNYLVKEYQTELGQPAALKLKSGQETWIVGSSIAMGLGNYNKDSSVGTFGVGGGNPTQVEAQLEKNVIPRIKLMQAAGKMTLPSRVILIGMGLNGLAESDDQDKAQQSAEQNLEGYLRIAKTLQSLGINTVKIAPENKYPGKINSILAFNETLKTDPKYSDYYLPTTVDEAPLAEFTPGDNYLHYQGPAMNRVFAAEKTLRA